jgi:hypothetical protein
MNEHTYGCQNHGWWQSRFCKSTDETIKIRDSAIWQSAV